MSTATIRMGVKWWGFQRPAHMDEVLHGTVTSDVARLITNGHLPEGTRARILRTSCHYADNSIFLWARVRLTFP